MGVGLPERATAALLLAILMVLPQAAATQEWHATLEARSVHAGSDSSLEGGLGFFSAQGVLEQEALMPANFHLAAQHVRVEVDRMEAQAHSGASYHGVYGNTSVAHFRNAQATGIENRDAYRMLVVPLAGAVPIHVESHCGSARASTEDQVQRDPLAAPTTQRPPVEVDVSRSIQWQDCGPRSQVQFTGNFVLVLWDWDFEIRDAHGVDQYETGQLQHPLLQSAPDISGTVSQDQEAWVFVENGTLSLTLPEGIRHSLYLGPEATVRTSSGFLLQDVTGDFDLGGIKESVQQAEIRMQGVLDLSLRADGAAVATQAQGQLTGLYVDEQDLWTPVVQLTNTPATAPWLAFLILPAFLLVAWHVVPLALYGPLRRHHAPDAEPTSMLREHRAQAWTWLSQSRLATGRPRRALVYARLAVWAYPAKDSYLQRVRCLRSLGRHEAALQVHEVLDQVMQDDRSHRTRNAWSAYQLAQRHAPDQAGEWLRRARTYYPSLFLRLADAWDPTDSDAAPAVGSEARGIRGSGAYS